METMCKLKDVMDVLNEKGYFCLGHGTGRSNDSKEVVKSIFENGLRTKDNSLYYTSIGLDTGDFDNLETKLNNWKHCESKKIILIRIPIEFINVIGDTADLNGERYGAFMIEKAENGKIRNYVDSKFIVGCYDSVTHEFEYNDKFERVLRKETLETLGKQYKEALEKTKARLQRIEMTNNMIENQSIKDEVNPIYDKSLLDNFDFDDEIEWDMPSTGPKL